MPHLTIAGNRFLILLSTHMQTSMGSFYPQFTNRLLLYFVLGFIFIVQGLVALTLYKGPVLLINHMAFAKVYALHTALTYVCCQFAIDIMVCRFLPAWGCYSRRTVGKQWMIWSMGFLVAFVLHRSIILCMVNIYGPDIVAYYDNPQHPRPHHGVVLLYALPYWATGVFLAINILFHLQKDLPSGAANTKPDRSTPSGLLTVTINRRVLEIPHRHISHITVADHYSTIFYLKDDALENVFLRASLKELRQSLPDDAFMQIHRSHLVNLNHVRGLSKNRRHLKMKYASNGNPLPVSRHRLAALRARLTNSL